MKQQRTIGNGKFILFRFEIFLLDFTFSLDEKLELTDLDGLMNSNKQLIDVIKSDLGSLIRNNSLTYGSLIRFYNRGGVLMNLNNEVDILSEGVEILRNINKTLNSIEFETKSKSSTMTMVNMSKVDIVGNSTYNTEVYLKNFSNLMILKYLSNLIENTKNAVETKINQFVNKINSNENGNVNFSSYDNLLKKNISDFFSNINKFNNYNSNVNVNASQIDDSKKN